MATNFNTPPENYVLPSSWHTPGKQDYLTHHVWELILKGENDPDEFVDFFEDELEEFGIAEDEARNFFAQVIEMRREQQRGWGESPKTALTQAFEALEGIGVVARQHFTCCGTCGSAEIGDERDESRQWRGYVFFHQQDTDQIFEFDSTYVNYGLFLDAFYSEEQWDALGAAEKDKVYERLTVKLMDEEVIPTLERHGIGVVWNRDLGTRILLENAEYVVLV